MGSTDVDMSETVRQRVEKAAGDGTGHMIRLKLRVDLDLTNGLIMSSLVAWEQPAQRVILNKVWSPADMPLWSTRIEHINLELRHVLNEHCEPFPL